MISDTERRINLITSFQDLEAGYPLSYEEAATILRSYQAAERTGSGDTIAKQYIWARRALAPLVREYLNCSCKARDGDDTHLANDIYRLRKIVGTPDTQLGLLCRDVDAYTRMVWTTRHDVRSHISMSVPRRLCTGRHAVGGFMGVVGVFILASTTEAVNLLEGRRRLQMLTAGIAFCILAFVVSLGTAGMPS